MKKALAFISALTFASASQSDNELRLRPVSYNPNEDFPFEDFPQVFPRKFARDLPPVVYADDDELRVRSIDFVPEEFLLNGSPYDEQSTQQTQPAQAESSDDSLYTGWNIVQNWHYPLKPIPTTNPFVPFKPVPVQNQPKIEEESVDNALYQLGQLIKQGVEVKNREQETVTKSKLRPNAQARVFSLPSEVKKERQQSRD